MLAAGVPGRPSVWTADWVKHRMVEAFTIERRIPDKRVGPAIVKGAWAKSLARRPVDETKVKGAYVN